MAEHLAQRDLRNSNAKVIDEVVAGKEFIVTRNGQPVAELRPVRATRRTFVPRGEIATMAAADDRIDWRRFRADTDAVIDQSL